MDVIDNGQWKWKDYTHTHISNQVESVFPILNLISSYSLCYVLSFEMAQLFRVQISTLSKMILFVTFST